MPSYSAAITAMTSFFNTGWAGATTVIWGEDDNNAIPDTDTWVRFNIKHFDGAQITMGAPTSNRFEQKGTIIIQIFQKEGNFGLDAQAKASAVLDLYQGADSGGIHYYNARVREVGNDDNGWYQINVLADFRYEQLT